MRRVMATLLFLAVLLAPASASAQSPLLEPYSDPDQDALTAPSMAPGYLDVRIKLDDTGEDTVEIRGSLPQTGDYFSLSRNVADALGLDRDAYEIDADGYVEVEDFGDIFRDSYAEEDIPQALLTLEDRLATRDGSTWTYALDTEDLQRTAIQNGFTDLSVIVCPVTDDFDTSASTEDPEPFDGCQDWSIAADADPIQISVVETPDTASYWNSTIGQAVTGVIFFIVGLIALVAARRKGHLKTLNGASIGWIIGLSLFAMFVWFVATAVMLVSNDAVQEYAFANDLSNGGLVLAFVLPALLPTLGVLLVIILITFARPPVKANQQQVTTPSRGTGGPTPAWMNTPTPPPAPAAPAAPAPAEPAQPVVQTPAEQPLAEPEVPIEEQPKREDPPSWNPPS